MSASSSSSDGGRSDGTRWGGAGDDDKSREPYAGEVLTADGSWRKMRVSTEEGLEKIARTLRGVGPEFQTSFQVNVSGPPRVHVLRSGNVYQVQRPSLGSILNAATQEKVVELLTAEEEQEAEASDVCGAEQTQTKEREDPVAISSSCEEKATSAAVASKSPGSGGARQQGGEKERDAKPPEDMGGAGHTNSGKNEDGEGSTASSPITKRWDPLNDYRFYESRRPMPRPKFSSPTSDAEKHAQNLFEDALIADQHARLDPLLGEMKRVDNELLRSLAECDKNISRPFASASPGLVHPKLTPAVLPPSLCVPLTGSNCADFCNYRGREEMKGMPRFYVRKNRNDCFFTRSLGAGDVAVKVGVLDREDGEDESGAGRQVLEERSLTDELIAAGVPDHIRDQLEYPYAVELDFVRLDAAGKTRKTKARHDAPGKSEAIAKRIKRRRKLRDAISAEKRKNNRSPWKYTKEDEKLSESDHSSFSSSAESLQDRRRCRKFTKNGSPRPRFRKKYSPDYHYGREKAEERDRRIARRPATKVKSDDEGSLYRAVTALHAEQKNPGVARNVGGHHAPGRGASSSRLALYNDADGGRGRKWKEEKITTMDNSKEERVVNILTHDLRRSDGRADHDILRHRDDIRRRTVGTLLVCLPGAWCRPRPMKLNLKDGLRERYELQQVPFADSARAGTALPPAIRLDELSEDLRHAAVIDDETSSCASLSQGAEPLRTPGSVVSPETESQKSRGSQLHCIAVVRGTSVDLSTVPTQGHAIVAVFRILRVRTTPLLRQLPMAEKLLEETREKGPAMLVDFLYDEKERRYLVEGKDVNDLELDTILEYQANLFLQRAVHNGSVELGAHLNSVTRKKLRKAGFSRKQILIDETFEFDIQPWDFFSDVNSYQRGFRRNKKSLQQQRLEVVLRQLWSSPTFLPDGGVLGLPSYRIYSNRELFPLRTDSPSSPLPVHARTLGRDKVFVRALRQSGIGQRLTQPACPQSAEGSNCQLGDASKPLLSAWAETFKKLDIYYHIHTAPTACQGFGNIPRARTHEIISLDRLPPCRFRTRQDVDVDVADSVAIALLTASTMVQTRGQNVPDIFCKYPDLELVESECSDDAAGENSNCSGMPPADENAERKGAVVPEVDEANDRGHGLVEQVISTGGRNQDGSTASPDGDVNMKVASQQEQGQVHDDATVTDSDSSSHVFRLEAHNSLRKKLQVAAEHIIAEPDRILECAAGVLNKSPWSSCAPHLLDLGAISHVEESRHQREKTSREDSTRKVGQEDSSLYHVTHLISVQDPEDFDDSHNRAPLAGIDCEFICHGPPVRDQQCRFRLAVQDVRNQVGRRAGLSPIARQALLHKGGPNTGYHDAHSLDLGHCGMFKVRVPPAAERVLIPENMNQLQDGGERGQQDVGNEETQTVARYLLEAGICPSQLHDHARFLDNIHISIGNRGAILVHVDEQNSSILGDEVNHADTAAAGQGGPFLVPNIEELTPEKEHSASLMVESCLKNSKRVHSINSDPRRIRHRCPYQVRLELLDTMTRLWRHFDDWHRIIQIWEPIGSDQIACTFIPPASASEQVGLRKTRGLKALTYEQRQFNAMLRGLRLLLFGSGPLREDGHVDGRDSLGQVYFPSQSDEVPLGPGAHFPPVKVDGIYSFCSSDAWESHLRKSDLLAAIRFDWELVFPANAFMTEHDPYLALAQEDPSRPVHGPEYFEQLSKFYADLLSSTHDAINGKGGPAEIHPVEKREPSLADTLRHAAVTGTSATSHSSGPLELVLTRDNITQILSGCPLPDRMLAAITLRGAKMRVVLRWYLEEVNEHPKSYERCQQLSFRANKFYRVKQFALPLAPIAPITLPPDSFTGVEEGHLQVGSFANNHSTPDDSVVDPTSSQKQRRNKQLLMEASSQYAVEAFKPRRAIVLRKPLPEKLPSFASRDALGKWLLSEMGDQYLPAEEGDHVWVAPLPLSGEMKAADGTFAKDLLYFPIGETTPDATIARKSGKAVDSTSSCEEGETFEDDGVIGDTDGKQSLATPAVTTDPDVTTDDCNIAKKYAVFRLSAAYHLDFSSFSGWRPQWEKDRASRLREKKKERAEGAFAGKNDRRPSESKKRPASGRGSGSGSPMNQATNKDGRRKVAKTSGRDSV
ncbi:unnamed protein product [Amoebophrya sp. A120]|nr:unnamed protein product [Amoebophrya sp. A120]|eukprot:GSA120T00018628001.1